MFTGPWSAAVTYLGAASWVERICAENPHEYYGGTDTEVPVAHEADF